MSELASISFPLLILAVVLLVGVIAGLALHGVPERPDLESEESEDWLWPRRRL